MTLGYLLLESIKKKKVLVTQFCLTLCNPMDCSPLIYRFLCPWNSLGKTIGVGSHSLLQGNLPNPGIVPKSPTLQADSLPTEPYC